VSFVALSVDHPQLEQLTSSEAGESVRRFIARVREERKDRTAEPSSDGVPLGTNCVHPLTGESVPLFVSAYVLQEYGSGAAMGVPAHDERDLALVNSTRTASGARLSIRRVLSDGHDAEHVAEETQLENSGRFSGLGCEEGRARIVAEVQRLGIGEASTMYR
jgi:leucyl-tRNA synthetase